VGQDAAREPERRLQHHAQDQGETVGVELRHRGDVLQPRVVDEHVDGRQRVHRVEVGQVANDGLHAGHVVRDLLDARLVAVDGVHERTVGREAGDHGRPYARCRARDQSCSSGEEGHARRR
jgi:hypothetical protein